MKWFLSLIACCLIAQCAMAGDPPITVAMFAGTYSTTDGKNQMGYRLLIKSNGTYQMGLVRPQPEGSDVISAGTASIDKGELFLKPTEPKGQTFRYTPVVWGQRHYLIEFPLQFTNAINFGGEPRDTENGQHFLRLGDWNKKADGLPPLPEPWGSRLLKTPIVGKITASKGNEATVNLGSADGVFVGMTMPFKGDKWSGMTQVSAVTEHECTLDTGAFVEVPVGTAVGSHYFEKPIVTYSKPVHVTVPPTKH